LASCSISGKVTVYSLTDKRPVGVFAQKNWMWSVHWVLCPPDDITKMQRLLKKAQEIVDLEDLVLVCSDAFIFHLFTFKVEDSVVTMEKACQYSLDSISNPGFGRESFRLSLVKKIPDLPLIVGAVQHASVVVILQIGKTDGTVWARGFRTECFTACWIGIDGNVQKVGGLDILNLYLLSLTEVLYVFKTPLNKIEFNFK
jgi:hypothetical protein